MRTVKYLTGFDEDVIYDLLEGDLGTVYHEMPSMMGPGHTDHSASLSDGRWISWSPLDGHPSVCIPSDGEPWGSEPMCGLKPVLARAVTWTFLFPECVNHHFLEEMTIPLAAAGFLPQALEMVQFHEDLSYHFWTY